MKRQKPSVLPVSERLRQLEVARVLNGWRMLVMEKCDELPEETEGGMEENGRSAEEAEPAPKGHYRGANGKER